jgi:ribosomal protein S18 acetylase RimI-like enzyme
MRATLRPLRGSDHLPLTELADRWCEGPVRSLLPRLFFDHFQPSSFAAERDGAVVGFLVGFRSQTDPAVAYVHFVAVAPEARRSGVGRQLYQRFFEAASAMSCRAVESITSPVNRASIAFHRRMEFAVVPGDGVYDGLPVWLDHAGPGQHRLLFRRRLP